MAIWYGHILQPIWPNCVNSLSIFVRLNGFISAYCRLTKRYLLELYLSSYPGLTDGRKCFSNQLNNSKTVKRLIICVNAELKGSHVRAIEWALPPPPLTQNRGVANRRPQIWAHHAGSSSGLLTIVVMTLFFCRRNGWKAFRAIGIGFVMFVHSFNTKSAPRISWEPLYLESPNITRTYIPT